MPQLDYAAMHRISAATHSAEILNTGCVIVKGAVSQAEAHEWDNSIREYIAANQGKVRGMHFSWQVIVSGCLIAL